VAIWSTLFVEILQGFQIDTDHWRHFWLMLGLIWGLFGLSQAHRRAAMSERGNQLHERSRPSGPWARQG